MQKYQKLNRFPLGAIHAEGFLKEQMIRGKNGMAGHLYELEPGMIHDPFIHKTHVPAWGNGDQSGWGAEISGNYWTGYIQHAFVLNDPDMIRIATDWVNTMIQKQRPDGYLGTYYEPDAKIHEDYNAWGTSCVMRGLLAFYEATGREDVLNAVYRCMLWFCENWAGDQKTSYSGGAIIEPMIFCYYHVGDERLVQFALDYEDFLARHDLFKNSCHAYLTEDLHYASNHTSAVGTHVRNPALIYSVTGDADYLEASQRMIRLVREKCVQPTGGPVSNAEFLGPKGPLGETEYCSFATHNALYAYMSYITGEARYGDYMEELFYNAAQGARKKDERAIAYLSAPNQIYATDGSSTAGTWPDMQVYAPCYATSCCPVNSVVVVPEFVRGMILHNDAGDLYMTAYGPCSLHTDDVTLLENTFYPFRHHVSLEIESRKERSVFLRIPEWATGYQITLNGIPCSVSPAENGYVQLKTLPAGQSCVQIHFDTDIRIFRVDDTDGSAKYPMAIKYGPLIYSYHIPENWKPIPGSPMTPLPEGWSWYNVVPDVKYPETGDFHDNLARRRDINSWNIALDENLRPEDIQIEERDESGYVWENPMIRLHTRCYKAPFLYPVYPIRTTEPMTDRQFVTHELPLTLEPYGCTNLRITFFPRADMTSLPARD